MLDVLLFAAFALGHAALWVVLINYVYALPWPKKLLKLCRTVTGLVVVGVPVAVLILDGFAFTETLDRFFAAGERWPLAIYELACVAFAIPTPNSGAPRATLPG